MSSRVNEMRALNTESDTKVLTRTHMEHARIPRTLGPHHVVCGDNDKRITEAHVLCVLLCSSKGAYMVLW